MSRLPVPVDFDLEVGPAHDLAPVHFVGIGGAGMSAIAQVMVERGLAVSGSDAVDVPVLARLRHEGAEVAVGFDAGRVAHARTVVVGSAINEDNEEVVQARLLGRPILHRSQALQSLMVQRRGVAVAGTNGKSTTSAMTVHVLTQTGHRPSFAVGATIVGEGTNGAERGGDIFVAEADESDGSFVVYSPVVAVVTSIQADHLDYYGTEQAVREGFKRFAHRIAPDGCLVACADDPGSLALAVEQTQQGSRVRTYGFSDRAEVRVAVDRVGPNGQSVCWEGLGPQPIRGTVPMPGRHNVANATAAVVTAVELGVPPQDAVSALASFAGVERRFQLRGEMRGVRVYDDYAHNPAKVAAAVEMGKQAAGQGRLIAVFQPHLFSRTRDLADGLAQALRPADVIAITDIYPARETPIPGVSAQLVVDRLRDHAQVITTPTLDDALSALCEVARAGDVVVTIGAGDVNHVGARFLKQSSLAHGAGSGGE